VVEVSRELLAPGETSEGLRSPGILAGHFRARDRLSREPTFRIQGAYEFFGGFLVVLVMQDLVGYFPPGAGWL